MTKKILLLLCLITSLQTWAKEQRPNIVFIFSDDHAIKTIGAYGQGFHQSPNIDRLAKDGAVFLNSYCANSICGPSRASILTGKHSHKNGFLRNEEAQFNGQQFTFPQALQKSGYQTALIGKWHLGLKSDPTGFDHWEIMHHQGRYYQPVFYSNNEKGQRQTRKLQGYVTDVVTELSLDWLKKRDKDKPFLLMAQHKAPHRSFCPPPRYLNRYDDKTFPEPKTLYDNLENRTTALKENEMMISKHMQNDQDLKIFYRDKTTGKLKKTCKEYSIMTRKQKELWQAAYLDENEEFITASKNWTEKEIIAWKYQRYIKNYLRTADAVDDSVGNIVAYLKENNLLENTIIVYSSDQGFYLGEHGWFDKRWIYEESARMPLIISWPGMKKGQKIKELVQNIDYAPSFLEAAGISIPSEIQGQSLKPLLMGEKTDWRQSLYYHYYEENSWHNVTAHEAIIKPPYKLANFYHRDGWNLYDLKANPSETKSFHKDPKYATILNDLKEELSQLRAKYQVPENASEQFPKGSYWQYRKKLQQKQSKGNKK